MNTYTKLKDGSWGVRIEGAAIRGQSVSIQTKAGATKQETVGAVLWTGPDRQSGKTITLCSVAKSGGYPRSSGGALAYAKAHNYAPGGKRCPNCGQRGCSGAWGDLCDED